MLDALRRGAQGWLAKLMFALLIVSFGVFWNVSDSIRQVTHGTVASVGSRDISIQQFQRAFQSDLQALQGESGQKITAEQALMFGLDKQTLDQLIAQQSVQQHAEKLGLGLSDEALAEGVRKDPNFAGGDGKFSRVILDNLMRQLNVSERGFLALRREDELRRQLIDAMRGAIVAPVPAVIDLNAYNEETRTVEFVTLDASKVKPAEPDEAKLKETYENNKGRFMTPEYRKIAALLLNTDDLKKDVTLTDDELKTAYTETKESYDKPERRRIQQIPFKDKAAAEEARKQITSGKKNFMDVAKDVGAKEDDVNLGLVAKKQLIDPKIADAAFKLERDKLSDVIEGQFSIVLLRAVEIQAGEESTFDKVKDQVRDKLAAKRAAALLHDRIDLVEEGRNAGKTLADIGKEQKLRFIEVEAVDRENKTPDGKTAIEQPDADKLVAQVFRTQPGDPQDAFELGPDSYAWFDVVSIAETKQKPFDEVKDKVREVYTELETSKLLDEKAKALADRLKNGEAIDKVAADAGGKPDLLEDIKRNMSPPGLTTDAVKQAFSLAKGAAGTALTSDKASRSVFRVKDIKAAPEPSKEQQDKLAQDVRRSLEADFIVAYLAALKQDLGVTINQAELKRATGVAPEPQ